HGSSEPYESMLLVTKQSVNSPSPVSLIAIDDTCGIDLQDPGIDLVSLFPRRVYESCHDSRCVVARVAVKLHTPFEDSFGLIEFCFLVKQAAKVGEGLELIRILRQQLSHFLFGF